MSDYGQDIDLSPLDSLFDMKKVAEAMQPEVLKAMEHVKGAITRKLPDGATGNLRRAVKAVAIITEHGVQGQVFVQEDNPAYGYWKFVEDGRRPGKFPPWSKEDDPLFKWVQRKITSSLFKTTGKVQRKTPERQKMLKGISFLIARKIAKKGTKAQRPFALGWAEAQGRVETIIEYGFQKAIATQQEGK